LILISQIQNGKSVDKLSAHKNNKNSNGLHKTAINYPILAVNAGIIGAVFIFFAIAAQVPASTIFALDIKKCSFGFNLLAQHAQIGVVMVGGIIILLFSISSVFALARRSIAAAIATSTGFAVMFIAAAIIVSSLACRLPTDFFIYMMVLPFIVIIAVIVGVQLYAERKAVNSRES
jgi:hypothetical protein